MKATDEVRSRLQPTLYFFDINIIKYHLLFGSVNYYSYLYHIIINTIYHG